MVLDYDASPQQKRKIAQYCMALGIVEPIEEAGMTVGTAGKLIRELQAQVELERREKKERYG